MQTKLNKTNLFCSISPHDIVHTMLSTKNRDDSQNALNCHCSSIENDDDRHVSCIAADLLHLGDCSVSQNRTSRNHVVVIQQDKDDTITYPIQPCACQCISNAMVANRDDVGDAICMIDPTLSFMETDLLPFVSNGNHSFVDNVCHVDWTDMSFASGTALDDNNRALATGNSDCMVDQEDGDSLACNK